MTLIPMYKVCPFCRRRYSWNPDAMQIRCPYCYGVAPMMCEVLKKIVPHHVSKIVFKYYGINISSVMELLPVAKIISIERGMVYTIQVEAIGKEKERIEKWLRRQGDRVKVLNENSNPSATLGRKEVIRKSL